MPKQTLTPQQKLFDKQRKALLMSTNACLGAWNFHRLKTWHDVFQQLGFDANYINTNFPKEKQNSSLTFSELKSYLAELKQQQEKRIQDDIRRMEDATVEFNDGSTDSDRVRQLHGRTVEQRHIDKSNRDYATTRQNLDSSVHDRTGTEGIEQSPLSTSHGEALSQSRKATAKLTEKAKDTDKWNESNNYGLIPSPNEKVFLRWFQKKAIAQAMEKILVKKYSGILLNSGTGTGKTFMGAAIIRRLMDISYHDGKSFSPTPYLVITKTSVVEQQRRVFQNYFNIDPDYDVLVANIEMLRTGRAKLYVQKEEKIINGEPSVEYSWRKHTNPVVLLFDESQGARRQNATQTKIITRFSRLPNTVCISCSASPFLRVSEARTFAISTKRPLEHLGFPLGSVLSEETWSQYARIISSPDKPEDYATAAVNKLREDLDDYIITVKGVRPQFKAINKVEKINFSSPEERLFYEAAYERFLAQKAKKEAANDAGDATGFSIFTELLMFQMAAEEIKVNILADRMWADVQAGKASVCGVKFKKTIIKIVMRLEEKYGVKRDNISLIWGGGQTQLTKKQKAKAKIRELGDKLLEIGSSVDELLKDSMLDDVEDRVLMDLPEHLRLASQDMQERQEEIDRFQSGKSLFCLFTFRSGGTGLSLHHCDELTKEKVRCKESGYAYEEDIPKIPTRQRKTLLATTYSGIELVQCLGRAPRLTSLSDTEQTILLYNGTIETEIAAIVEQKLKCLSVVNRMPNESWETILTREKTVSECIATTKDISADEEGALLDESESEEEDED